MDDLRAPQNVFIGLIFVQWGEVARLCPSLLQSMRRINIENGHFVCKSWLSCIGGGSLLISTSALLSQKSHLFQSGTVQTNTTLMLSRFVTCLSHHVLVN